MRAATASAATRPAPRGRNADARAARAIARAVLHWRDAEPRAGLALLAPYLADPPPAGLAAARIAEALLAAADCDRALSDYTASHARLGRAAAIAAELGDARLAALADVGLARLAYFQGSYAASHAHARQALATALAAGERMVAASACHAASVTYRAQDDFDAAYRVAGEGLAHARASGDRYQETMLLNQLAQHFSYKVLAKTLPRHALAAHTVLEPADVDPADPDLAAAAGHLTEALAVARTLGAVGAIKIFEVNLARIRVLQGRAAAELPVLKRCLIHFHDHGMRNHEIAVRQAYAWALRCAGHFAESLNQLDTAIATARKVGMVTRMVEFMHYDRSLVLAAQGDFPAALKSYERYRRYVSAWQAGRGAAARKAHADAVPRQALEPFYLKRADRYLAAEPPGPVDVDALARHCGTSVRTLQAGFKRFRGVTPVAHARNLRLDRARAALLEGAAVGEVAGRFGFASPTTFSLEFRRRFGVPPRDVR